MEERVLMEKRTTAYRRWGKRLIDVLGSAAALVLLSPMLIGIALLVRVFLGAPILFRQVRSGRGQKAFTILKFRTMTDDCDANGKALSDTLRLTALGRFLRATSLDELPELFNVLKGDMSLVGPRPLLPRYDAWYRPEELERFDGLPGITGWAQINGRNALSWDRRFEHDVWYVRTCGLWLDVKILLFTVVKVLRRENVQVNTDLTLRSLDEERREKLAAQAKAPHEMAAATNEVVSVGGNTLL
jgi:lipopolysaccharide/colanic/teichoic acid biosynthesis glycosyltransferase